MSIIQTAAARYNAYNGNDLVNSSDIYKIIASATALTSSSFTSYSKQAIEADFTKNLQGFTITKQASTTICRQPSLLYPS